MLYHKKEYGPQLVSPDVPPICHTPSPSYQKLRLRASDYSAPVHGATAEKSEW